MTPRTAALLLALAAIAAAPALASAESGSGNTHPAWTLESCLACHRADESATLSPRVARPCRTLCATCHDDRDGHHPVGVRIERTPPAPLLLTASGTNTCVTCHDTTKPRVDSSPWESRSLFERIVRRSKEHPTRYLALKNDKGQLCLSCH
jgi:predicted CXXCH cytochrome family protein